MSAKDKGNVCLICDASMSVSTRKCCPIFEQRISNSDRTIVSVISYILGINLTEDDVHSNVICKKCFKICNEVDELEERLAELKLELSSNYQKTLKKQSGSKSPNQDIEFSETYNKSPIIKRGRGRPPLIKKEEDNDEKEIIIELLHSPGENSFNNDVTNGEENPLENEIIEVNGDDLSLDDEDAEANIDNDAIQSTRIKADSDEEFVPYKLTKTMQKKKKPPGGTTRKLRENQLTTDCILIPQMVVCRENNSNMYKCLICPPELKFTADSRGIISHLRDSHNIRLYICDLCGKEFFRRPELSKHLDEHIKRDDTYECDICCRVFRNFRLYRVHRKMHVSQPKNFTCEICGKRYGSRNLLEEHKNMHTGRRPYRCSLCEKNFTSKYTLKAHEKTHEDRPRPYACINCGKTFLTQQNLIHHERIHSGITNYICKECGKSFNTARNLETHFIVHTGFKPNICRLCGKAFTKKVELRRHERSHSGEKPYQCEFCGASFSQRSNLQSHKRTTHYDDKRYKCTDCGRAFKRRRLLDYHMKAAHTGERPHKCDICDATFIYPEHFKKHKLIHTGAKPYKCEVCGKAFNSRDNRNAHRFVHSDKKPYECPVCGTGFMRKPLLYNHMNTVGHHHDTIVVNQPKLSVIEDEENFDQPIITEPIEEPSAVQHLEMTLYTDTDGSQKLIHTGALPASLEEEKYYLTDIKDHVVIPNSVTSSQGDNVHIVTAQYATHELNDHRIHENNQHHNLSNSIISDGIQIQANEDSILSGEPHSQANNSIAYHETATLKTENGIQILQIRINNDARQKQWLNILQSQPQ